MKRDHLIFAHCKDWSETVFDFVRILFDDQIYNISFVRNKDELSTLCSKVPKAKIFFVHWNWKVSSEFLEQYDCFCFHMTDLPYGRGGSPLQNLILRGKKETKICALKMVEELDAGPVYLRRSLTLEGSALDIFIRASKICVSMALSLVQSNISPIKQVGDITTFSRLSEVDNLIEFKNTNIEKIYDLIRMLDAPGYPSAWVGLANFRLEFVNAGLIDETIHGTYRLRLAGQEIRSEKPT